MASIPPIVDSFSSKARTTITNMGKMSIHQKIKAARKRLDMTEKQFGDAVGVSRGAVQQWEKEGGTAPRRKNQAAVAKLMGITVADLMGNEVLATPPAPPPGNGKPEFSPDAKELARMLDDIKDKTKRKKLYAQCILILTGTYQITDQLYTPQAVVAPKPAPDPGTEKPPAQRRKTKP